ncbi:oxidoreductase [Streptomyces sp. NRRL F-5630]|uniref:oxidoreductase n=1 Tax=unclassified Streptomyces TaxID=2593676 RepID=UPI00056A46A3|nr:oxidoreductase [Streptomyces sp. NRRL F-5630]
MAAGTGASGARPRGWSAARIPAQEGRTAVVTGADSGIGYVTARELARHGAHVVLACRSERRGADAVARLLSQVPGAHAEFSRLDLGDLASVREFAARHVRRPVDVLLNNAGVMPLPYARTADGFERQFGVNHLGHFALTGLLLPALLRVPGSRVVTVSSGLHVLGNIDPRDLDSARHYRRRRAHARSKTANLLFTHELARRLDAAGAGTVAAAAHPGLACAHLRAAGARREGRTAGERLAALATRLVGQRPEAGALPSLYAATAPGVAQDSFTGPRFLWWRGAPAPSWRAPWTRDDETARRLWAASEELTGVRYDLPEV